MNKTVLLLLSIIMVFIVRSFMEWPERNPLFKKQVVIQGKAPSVFSEDHSVHLVFAAGDSILYCNSTDQGKSFSDPMFVSKLTALSVGGGRGPQITASKSQLFIAAVDRNGNIHTYYKLKNSNQWKPGNKINDIPEMAREGFVSLASNTSGELMAVWLDLREDKMNKVLGASSIDGGRSWSKNRIVFRSPDSTVCECCKPSIAMKDQLVVVMFRNWLEGNRDLYVIKSYDGGMNFEKAQKLGKETWKLNACPMDGGSFVIDRDNTIYTVWRRQDLIYSCEAGREEIPVAKGKQCSVAGKNNKFFIAYVNEGKIYCRKPDGNTLELGKGSYPKLLSFSDDSALCVFDNGESIAWVKINT